MNCVFCKIMAGEIPAKVEYEDERIIVIHDISPQAPVHLLIIPREHIVSAAYIDEHNADIIAYIYTKIGQLAKGMNLEGFRVVTNAGEIAAQSVPHLHFHLIAGERLSDKIN